MSATKTRRPAVAPPLRRRGSDTYTADELIDAYFKGVDHGSQSFMAVMVEKLEANVRLAEATARRLSERINAALETACDEVYLRIVDPTRIDARFLVAEEAYLAEDFDAAYAVAREERDAVVSETFDFEVSFLPDSDHLDRDALSADGFLRFKPETAAA